MKKWEKCNLYDGQKSNISNIREFWKSVRLVEKSKDSEKEKCSQ